MALEPANFRVAPSSGVPIFRQIIDQVHALIACGTLKAGDMLPSIREMSRALEVNMMTVSKAYSRLEADDVLERVRGRGMRVAPVSNSRSVTDRKREFHQQVAPALHRANQLGLTDDQILAVIHKILKEHANDS